MIEIMMMHSMDAIKELLTGMPFSEVCLRW